LETEKNVAGVAALALLEEVLKLNLDLKSKSTKTSKLEAELEAVLPVLPELFLELTNYWVNLLQEKNW
jgi:hypothetical protein